ncbi:hypothetical protein HCN44_009505 [Aphidius gifuensis]|uniref:Cadherin domain-containing protein n=1 Tax=Aphidius gifuensis TaxID=684658 RepID=A0A834Y7I1_APHGI|nr:hypothetical protein HCN44_009505 [Aphidius gifuensis]
MYQSRLLRTAAYIATVCLIIFAIIVFGFRGGKPDNNADKGTVDYRPVFGDFNRDVDISDGVFTENCLTVILAKRFNDTHNLMPNKNIIYSLEDNKSFFSIDNAGCLRMKTSINTSMANGTLNWCIYIIASDEKYPMNTNKVAININLKKKIQIDNAYLYNNKSDEYKVPELLEATESFSNETEQKYEIPTTTLDKEKSFDNFTPKLNVKINKKQKKKECKFSQPIYIAFISENATVDTPVTKPLEVNNLGQVRFKILNNDTNDFSLSHAHDSDKNINSTQIIVNQALSYLNKSIYELDIMASDDISDCTSKIIIYVRKENDTGIIFKKKHDSNNGSHTSCSDCFRNFNDRFSYIQYNSTECITEINAVDTFFENGLANNPIIYNIREIWTVKHSKYNNEEILKDPIVAIDKNTGCLKMKLFYMSMLSQKLAVRAYYEQDDSVELLMTEFLFHISMMLYSPAEGQYEYFLKKNNDNSR